MADVAVGGPRPRSTWEHTRVNARALERSPGTSLVLDYLLVASDTHRMLLSDDGRT